VLYSNLTYTPTTDCRSEFIPSKLVSLHVLEVGEVFVYV